MTGGRRRIWRRGTATLALAAAAGAALAQDTGGGGAAGGTLLTFGISGELRHDDNLGLNAPARGDSTLFDTRLSFGISSRTRSQALDLRLDGTWRISEGPDGREGGLADPQLSFRYERESARSRLTLTAGYVEADLGLLSPDTDPQLVIDPADGSVSIDTGTGRRSTATAGLHFETGIDMPLGFTLDLRHSDRRYRDTVDPDLNDSRSDSATARLRMDLSPVLSAGLVLDASRSESAGTEPVERESRGAALSFSYAIDAATRAEARLGWRHLRTERDGILDEEQEGITARLSFDRDLANGSAGLSYAHDVDSGGGRDTLSLSRTLEMPRGRLAFTLGVTRGESGGDGLVGQISYARQFPRGGLQLALVRDLRSDSEGEEVLSTRLSAGWTHQLTALSGLRLDLAYARIEGLEAGGDTTEQGSLELAWQRQMTEDWQFSAGWRHRISRDRDEDADSDALFLNLGRTFSVRY